MELSKLLARICKNYSEDYDSEYYGWTPRRIAADIKKRHLKRESAHG